MTSGTDPALTRVAHIVPALDIGGVEVAIWRSQRAMRARFDYRVFTVRRTGSLKCEQRGITHLLRSCFTGRWRPQVVVTSLWWAHPFGYLLRLFGCRWLAFFHSGNYSHGVERRVLSWAWRRADGRLVDSSATAAFLGDRDGRNSNVVPYVFEDQEGSGSGTRDIDVVWVGRNSPEKRLDLVRDLLLALARRRPSGRATCIVAGSFPDEFAGLDKKTGWQIEILRSVQSAEVLRVLRRSRFYVLLSDFEGMSMSTIEAAQAGCVAVVRPVGEIVSYLGESSAILVKDVSPAGIEDAADRVHALWEDADARHSLSERARSNLRAIPLYVTSLSEAIERQTGAVKT